MITKITSVEELKQIFTEILLNNTDKITDVSNESVLNAIAYGCGKLAQRMLINQAVVEAHIFPDTACGDYLDELAKLQGISPRNGAMGSTVYVRLEADPGTVYAKDRVRFTSSSGIVFLPDYTVTIGKSGMGYMKLSSQQAGSTTNVDALTINNITNAPNGHKACTNEYRATGGADEESDDVFRVRIKESVNQLARTTLSYIEQVFMKINPKVLRVYKAGIDANNKLNLIVVSTNGQNFTDEEFDKIKAESEEFLSLNELLQDTTGFAIELQNVDWLPIDLDFRVSLDPSYDYDEVRRQMQLSVSKLFDYRYWKYGDKVEWENMLYAIRNIEGVRYVPDTHFRPQSDILVPKYRLPILRGFTMKDLEGNIIFDNYSILAKFDYDNSYNYPNNVDIQYQSSVLSTI